MSKDRAPKKILKDKRTLIEKATDRLKELPMEEVESLFRKFKARNQGNPKEAGASITRKRREPSGVLGDLKGKGRLTDADRDLASAKAGGLMEATARLKAKGMKDGGMVVKEKVVSIDKSPNSGLITTKGFGAGRRT